MGNLSIFNSAMSPSPESLCPSCSKHPLSGGSSRLSSVVVFKHLVDRFVKGTVFRIHTTGCCHGCGFAGIDPHNTVFGTMMIRMVNTDQREHKDMLLLLSLVGRRSEDPIEESARSTVLSHQQGCKTYIIVSNVLPGKTIAPTWSCSCKLKGQLPHMTESR